MALDIYGNLDDALNSAQFCDYLDKMDLTNAYLMLNGKAVTDLYYLLKEDLGNPFLEMVKIPGLLFSHNMRIKEVTVPANISIIGVSAFGGCKNLEKVEIEDGLILIKSGAFKLCDKLTAVFIPESVEHIADTAFVGCKNVTIYCKQDSLAMYFAKDHGIPYDFY